MTKKLFIILSFIGVIFICLLLPLYNYTIDQWRVLHKDYHYAYEKIMINKSFLKVTYLLENKNKYDTIIMGSSRNGSLDVDKISDHTYNLESSFSTIGTHLHNLKILLNNNVKIKNLWVAVNDYDTWKDSADFEDDWSRKTYKDNFFKKLKFYWFYLYKKIDKRDILILKNKYKLVKSERIIEKINSNDMYEREKYILANAQSWKNKMTSRGSILLGYDDSKYRIEKSINDMKQITKLCKKHKIKLTVFMYPSFYKTYISYNQQKIEEFKNKLVKVTPFYDFYMLDKIALNELNWFDSSHFIFSIGDYIIKNIKLNKKFVTKDNIEQHLLNVKDSIHKIIDKVLPIKHIYSFHANIDLSRLSPIFKLYENIDLCKSENISFYKKKEILVLRSSNKNSSIHIPKLSVSRENVILDLIVESKFSTKFSIFYKKEATSSYNPQDSFSRHMGVGTNYYHLSIPSEYLNNGLKINLGEKKGSYNIVNFIFY